MAQGHLFKSVGHAFSLVSLLLSFALTVLAQDSGEKPKAILVDEFSQTNECDFRGRIDSFLMELSNNPDSMGYIINYKPVDELPADRDRFPREQYFANHIAFRNFDRQRVTLVRGGYRESHWSELWLVPQGADHPAPTKGLSKPPVRENRTFLYGERSLPSGGSVGIGDGGEFDDMADFVLESVREEEARRVAAIEDELERADNASAPDANTTPANGDAPASEETEEPPAFIDPRTEEEKEAARFEWANVGIAAFIAERKGSSGVIFFYADDRRYDVGKLTEFVRKGRDLLTANGNISSSRLKVVFGGYRENPEVEFWYLPVKGQMPMPTPEDRPIEQPEETDN